MKRGAGGGTAPSALRLVERRARSERLKRRGGPFRNGDCRRKRSAQAEQAAIGPIRAAQMPILMSRIPERDIIVIGGYAGALQPLKEILRSLPSNLQAAVFVVLHVSADTPEEVVLSMADVGSLPARLARHGDVVEHGQVYIAPP